MKHWTGLIQEHWLDDEPEAYVQIEQETKNLKLVLAAPDLLDALIDLLGAWDRTIGANSDDTNKARAAIAKATQ